MNRNLALMAVLTFALLAKALIPSGWMPTGGKAFEITVCTGLDTHSLWLDDKGKLHKEDPTAPKDVDIKDMACSFAGLSALSDLPPTNALSLGVSAYDPVKPHIASVSIGRGLAAPPPPATGPPVVA